MARTPSLVDSGFMQGGASEDLPSVDVEIPQVEDFAGGAEIIQDGMGGAIVQALAEGGIICTQGEC